MSHKMKTEEKKKTTQIVPDIADVEKKVLKSIVAQDKQVRKIITSIYRAIYFESIKANVLIIGSSGTGKTATVELIAKLLKLPYTIEDATKYTQEGYYGANVEDMILNLVKNADYDFEKAQRGIIFIDEIDKKASTCDDYGRDVAGVEVLKSLLRIIEGTTMEIPIDKYGDITEPFSTKNLIVIFAGAFDSIQEIRKKRLNKNFTIGFNERNDEKTKNPEYEKQDLIEFGMTEEFVGRIDTIIEMHDLTVKDLETILKKSELSIFRRYQRELRKKGITLKYPKELYAKIAAKSLSVKTGARELSTTVNKIFENILYEVFANPSKYKTCTLDIDIVDDNTKYTLS